MNVKKEEWAQNMTVTFHTGALHTKDNSVESVKTAVESGAQITEIDVSFRPDLTPVMIHKENPSQDEGEFIYKALEIVKTSPDCKINLDLKSTANLKGLEELIKEYGLYERVFYTGVFDTWTEKVKADSTIPYYLNHKISLKEGLDAKAAQKVADKAKALGAIGVNSNYITATKLFCDVMHRNGLLVSLWTVNIECDMKKVLSFNVDNITTERPSALYDIMKKLGYC